MRTYVFTHESDAAVLRELDVVIADERGAMATVVARIAEVEERRLYLPAGYPSMFEYCVRKLHLSDQAAKKRIRAGRTARKFPAIFDALAAGRLHLSAIILLAPHLTPDTADELLAAAANQTRAEIEQLLARRFPTSDVPTRLEAIAPSPCTEQVSLGTPESATFQVSPGTPTAPPAPSVTPLSAARYALQVTIPQSAYDKLRYIQELLGHRIPSGDVAQVIERAFDECIASLEKQKFAATDTPRPRSGRSSANPRHIPAHVKRSVKERDQGKCTFVSETGQRCESRMRLEFDHIVPVARGGAATVENTRLLCRAHNQYEAECAFGSGFMNEKREQACAAAEVRARAAAESAEAEARARAAEEEARSCLAQEHARDLTSSLRGLGFRDSEARQAVEYCLTIPEDTLEARVRTALKFLRPRARVTGAGSVGVTCEARA